jgi:hypothetical protein
MMYGKFQAWFEEKIPKALQVPLLVGIILVALYTVYETFSSHGSGRPASPEAKQKFQEMLNKMRHKGGNANTQPATKQTQ